MQTVINLGIPLVPDTQNPELHNGLLPLHKALFSLANQLESVAGITPLSKEEYSQASPFTNIKGGDLLVEFGENVQAGQLITFVNAESKLIAIKANNLAFEPAVVDAHLRYPRAFSLVNGKAGEIGYVRLTGLHTFVSGLTPGTPLYASASSPGNLSLGVEGELYVGVALSSNVLWFSPSIPVFPAPPPPPEA